MVMSCLASSGLRRISLRRFEGLCLAEDAADETERIEMLSRPVRREDPDENMVPSPAELIDAAEDIGLS